MDIQEPSAQGAAYVQGVYQDFDCVFPIPSGETRFVSTPIVPRADTAALHPCLIPSSPS